MVKYKPQGNKLDHRGIKRTGVKKEKPPPGGHRDATVGGEGGGGGWLFWKYSFWTHNEVKTVDVNCDSSSTWKYGLY